MTTYKTKTEIYTLLRKNGASFRVFPYSREVSRVKSEYLAIYFLSTTDPISI